MSLIPQIILSNPFRVLGVFANSPKKDVVANTSKATKFLQVGRDVDFPLDLRAMMPPVPRSADAFSHANAQLSIAGEHLKYAQFWFIKMTQDDEDAFQKLYAGDVEGAMGVWENVSNVSSLQNRMVTLFCRGEFDAAIRVAENLYEQFADQLLAVLDSSGTLVKDRTDLIQMFIESLAEEIEPVTLSKSLVSDEWRSFLSDKTVNPIIARIDNEIDASEALTDENMEDAAAYYHAGHSLIKKTMKDFEHLKKLLPADDPRLETLGDRLALQILECVRQYYNHCFDSRGAMTLLQIGESMVMGVRAKELYDNNKAFYTRQLENRSSRHTSTSTSSNSGSQSGSTKNGCLDLLSELIGPILMLLIIGAIKAGCN